MKYLVRMSYIIDIPDGEIDGKRVSTAEIVEDAQWFIDQYARGSYCSMAETVGDDE